MPLASSVANERAGTIGSSHVHSLNDDCLIAIFYYVARDPLEPFYPREIETTKADQLICLTHVCQRWRGVVLDIPQLWADVAFVYPKGFPTLLGRARESPLRFANDAFGARKPIISNEQAHYMISHPERLRILEIHYQWPSLALAFAGKTMPILESLTFDYGGASDTDGEGNRFYFNERPIRAPLLKHAVFGTIYIPLIAPQLTSLHLGIADGLTGTFDLDSERFYALLKSSPLLESLSLHECFPEEAWANEESERVELPRLVKVDMTGYIAAIASMVDMIHLVNACSNISLTVYEVDEDGAADFACALAPFIQTALHDTLSVTGYLADRSNGHPGLRLFSSERTTKDSSIHDSYTLSVDVGSDEEDVDIMSFYQSIFEQLSEGQIRHLLVVHEEQENAFTWVDTIQPFHLPALSQSVDRISFQLENRGHVDPDFGEGLAPKFLLEDYKAYPSLTSLTLHGDGRHYAAATNPDKFGEFIQWLQKRRDRDIPLETIRLTGDVYNKRYQVDQSGTVWMGPQDWTVWQEVRSNGVRVIDERKLIPMSMAPHLLRAD
ncbi:unnamed protein product [Peniophora sp. CBMAI 1063]|nr:unnamed protein product [Peniophora sp. CBMAI 1063]